MSPDSDNNERLVLKDEATRPIGANLLAYNFFHIAPEHSLSFMLLSLPSTFNTHEIKDLNTKEKSMNDQARDMVNMIFDGTKNKSNLKMEFLGWEKEEDCLFFPSLLKKLFAIYQSKKSAGNLLFSYRYLTFGKN